jgi:hypothetical protein
MQAAAVAAVKIQARQAVQAAAVQVDQVHQD